MVLMPFMLSVVLVNVILLNVVVPECCCKILQRLKRNPNIKLINKLNYIFYKAAANMKATNLHSGQNESLEVKQI